MCPLRDCWRRCCLVESGEPAVTTIPCQIHFIRGFHRRNNSQFSESERVSRRESGFPSSRPHHKNDLIQAPVTLTLTVFSHLKPARALLCPTAARASNRRIHRVVLLNAFPSTCETSLSHHLLAHRHPVYKPPPHRRTTPPPSLQPPTHIPPTIWLTRSFSPTSMASLPGKFFPISALL